MRTIGDIRRAEIWLSVSCRSCSNQTYLPWRLLPASCADEMAIGAAAARFRCSRCGGRDVETTARNLLAEDRPFAALKNTP